MKLKYTFLLGVLTLTGCGNDGRDGINGTSGVNGLTSLVGLTRVSADPVLCASGSGTVITTGVDLNGNLILDNDEVQQTSVVCDGTNGVNGTNGAPASQYAVLKLIDPCGDAPGIYDEIGLRLVNGTIVFLFADNAAGNNPRLSVIGPGSYVTTDGSNCHFTVNAGLNLTDQLGNIFNP